MAEKSDPAAEKKAKRRAQDIARRHTIENVVAEFKDVVVAHYRPKWRNEVERILDREIVPRWKRKLITDITEQDVADVQAAIRERGAAHGRQRGRGRQDRCSRSPAKHRAGM